MDNYYIQIPISTQTKGYLKEFLLIFGGKRKDKNLNKESSTTEGQSIILN